MLEISSAAAEGINFAFRVAISTYKTFFLVFNLPNRKLNIYRMESLQFKGLETFMKPFQAFC